MAALAADNGVRTVVGLQARQAPAIEFIQELLQDEPSNRAVRASPGQGLNYQTTTM